MNSLPLHPILVHFPMALSALMPLLSFALWGLWLKGALPRRTWWVAVALQAVLLAGAGAALRSGEGDSEKVEKVLSEKLVDEHEEAAEAFTVGAALVLVLALGGGLLPKEGAAKLTALATAVGTLAVLGLGYRVGEKGGALVYRHNAAAAWAQPNGGAGPGGAAAGGGAVEAEASGGERKEHGSDRD